MPPLFFHGSKTGSTQLLGGYSSDSAKLLGWCTQFIVDGVLCPKYKSCGVIYTSFRKITTEVFMEKEDSEHKTETRGPMRHQRGCTTRAYLLAAWCKPICSHGPSRRVLLLDPLYIGKTLTLEAWSFSQTRAPSPSKTRISGSDWSPLQSW
jgi:hypothetical protein